MARYTHVFCCPSTRSATSGMTQRNHSMDYQREFDARLAERIVLEVASVVGVDARRRRPRQAQELHSGSARTCRWWCGEVAPILTAPVLATAQCNGCGKCCKVCRGFFVPEDFGNDLSRMGRLSLLAASRSTGGRASGSTTCVRPRRRWGEVFDPSWGGECNYLTATGCELTHEARPRQCRGLVPGEPGVRNCIEPGAEKYDFVAAWSGWADRVLEMGGAIEREREGCA